MMQWEAIELFREKILSHESTDKLTCTGDYETCTNEDCCVCAVRDCPNNYPLHYHEDGCPACFYFPDGDID
jgi:hypothetical protein